MTEYKKYGVFLILCLLVLTFSFLIFPKLGEKPLLDYDESIYTQVARQSLEGGSQLSFKWLGNSGLYRFEDWFEKPPLMIWLTQSGFMVFGVNEYGARFWIVIFSLLTIILTFLFGKKVFNSTAAGLISASVYFIAFQWIYNTGVLQFDIPVSFFIFLTLFGFYLARENSRYYFLFWIALGLGVMTKSVIGLLPLVAISVFSLLAWDFRFLKNKHFYLGVLAFTAIVIPWHLIEHLRHGEMFWHQYLFYHLLQRFSSGLEGNGRDFDFYWNILFKHRILFYSSIASLLYFGFRSFKSKAHLFVLTSALVIFLFFSYSKTKLPAYILPLYPLLTILIGITISEISSLFLKENRYRYALFGLIISFFVFLGFRYNNYRLVEAKQQYLYDSKEIGLFLKDNYLEQPVYFYSKVGTKPSVIFYSNRIVYFLRADSPKPKEEFILLTEVDPIYEKANLLLSTPTQKVYHIVK